MPEAHLIEIANRLTTDRTPLGRAPYYFDEASPKRVIHRNALGEVLASMGYPDRELVYMSMAEATATVTEELGITTLQAALLDVADRSRPGYDLPDGPVRTNKLSTAANNWPLRSALLHPEMLLGNHAAQIMLLGETIDRMTALDWQSLSSALENRGDLEEILQGFKERFSLININYPYGLGGWLRNGVDASELAVRACLYKLGLSPRNLNGKKLEQAVGILVNRTQLQEYLRDDNPLYLLN